MDSSRLAQVVHYTHWLFLLFVLTGWCLPWKAALIAHLIVIPGLIVHWRTNENRCVLTEMEERLKAKEPIGPQEAHEEAAEEGQFLKSAWEKAFGKKPTDELLSRIIYTTMAVVWVLSAVRLTKAVMA